ncbi:MAG: hypothetical protein H6936_00905 [Burkholderiales bacterium]|nr:hypothetical protein [Nitrosomonas sp.]MCP5273415.1 hypothetical protein [Burkholderiales bacterium]
MHYLIALKLNQPVQSALVDQSGWWAMDEGIEVVIFDCQVPCWNKPRRVVGIRQKTDESPKSKANNFSVCK